MNNQKTTLMKRYLLIIGILAISLQNAEARRWYVTPTGGGTGASWNSPMTLNDLMFKINITHEVRMLDEIWFQKGTYPALKLFYDATTTTWNGFSLRFYGGFTGNEVLLNQRKLNENETVLIGDDDTPAIWVESGNACLFNGFVLEGGNAEGGGIRVVNNTSEFVNIKIRNTHGDARGGAVFLEGTLYASQTQSPKLINVAIAGNNLDNPIYVCASSLELRNVTIADNSFPNGIILVEVGNASVKIYNSIIYGNSNDAIVFNTSNVNPADSYCEYSLLGNLNFVGSRGAGIIINEAPEFVDGYHLAEGSPGYNAGSNAAFPTITIGGMLEKKDLDSQTRIVETIDMGAYEYQEEEEDDNE